VDLFIDELYRDFSAKVGEKKLNESFYLAGNYRTAHTRSNERWNSYFDHWAYEDPSDN